MNRGVMRLVCAGLGILLSACGDGGNGESGPPVDVPGCSDDELALPEGQCIRPGIPPDGCGEGFLHEGDRGCSAILPEAPCPPGQMAVPGEEACREVAPCGDGPWGEIATDGNTQYVDGSYGGGASNGSAEHPFVRIQDGVDAAPSGAVVAVAEGRYTEDVRIEGKTVHLWGRCPALVELVGSAGATAAVLVRSNAHGTTIEGLAVTGAQLGIAITGSTDVTILRSWIHDTGWRALNFEDVGGPVNVHIEASLVEGGTEMGLFLLGANASMEASVIRGIARGGSASFGRGVNAQQTAPAGSRSSLTITGSVVADTDESGIALFGTDATIERTVVKDTGLDPATPNKRGIAAELQVATGGACTLNVSRTVVESSREVGVLVSASDGTFDALTVRDTVPNQEGAYGWGIHAKGDPTGLIGANIVVDNSQVTSSHDVGVNVLGSVASIQSTIVRDTQPDGVGQYGRGLIAESDVASGTRATLDLVSSLIDGSHDAGIFLGGADATIDSSMVRNTVPIANGHFGRGITVQAHPNIGTPSTAVLTGSVIENSHDAGIAILSSEATIAAVSVENTGADGLGRFGDGILVASITTAASAHLDRCEVAHSARAGLANFGATVTIASSRFVCQSFDFNGEELTGNPFLLEDLGENWCGCPEATGPCMAVSGGLEPPDPIAE